MLLRVPLPALVLAWSASGDSALGRKGLILNLAGKQLGIRVIFIIWAASFPAEKLFFSFLFLILKKNRSQNKTLTAQSKMAALTLFIKTRKSLFGLVQELYFPRDFGPLPSNGVFYGLQLLQELFPS